MGRYAQAKRRGSVVSSGVALPRPPAPLLNDIANQLRQSATGGDDTGGFVTLYWGAAPGGPYEVRELRAWSAAVDWADLGDLGEGYYVGTENGNGLAYSGESLQSNEWPV
jgi:hypothetical protein